MQWEQLKVSKLRVAQVLFSEPFLSLLAVSLAPCVVVCLLRCGTQQAYRQNHVQEYPPSPMQHLFPIQQLMLVYTVAVSWLVTSVLLGLSHALGRQGPWSRFQPSRV